ncbi:MAG: Response regulator containing a CheY-like receiver domain and a GGDEF domain [uncultured Frankineae bacterium]|uniref:Response regulator containing a CheY-like receiver domain and a GGDEF domain n=1 Tax=uncultured Frankineae bacterium TaxID=437475 RepID=A0A6J4KIM8_9ACTN|nr:MAG: Response regulator containing a CheY-like receiver domain and a GGDEF domain [uncultured Frankineae bacterium]
MDALTSSSDVFEEFFLSARAGLALADLNGSYVRANRTYASLLGRSPEDLVGMQLDEVLTGTGALDLEELREGRREALDSEQEYAHADGRSFWVLHGVASVAGPDGCPAWFAVSAQDITERRRVEQELLALTATLTERAVRDPLTGLPNRALFEERLRGALSRDARTGTATGVLFLDLDGFKDVNDRYGHRVGDAVLQSVAQRLAAAVRPADTVARLGGDEFVVLVEETTESGLHALADRLRRAVDRPMPVQDLTLQVGVSVGVAMATGGAADPSSLVSAADARMYEVKRRSR